MHAVKPVRAAAKSAKALKRTTKSKIQKKKPLKKIQKRSFSADVATESTLKQKLEQGELPLYPQLEPFADLETVRKTVETYNDSFQLNADATPFAGLGQIIKQYGKNLTDTFSLILLSVISILQFMPTDFILTNI